VVRVGTEDKKDRDASIITRLIADSIVFVFGLLVIVPVFGAIAGALVGLSVAYGEPMLGFVAWLLMLVLATYVIYRMYKHVREDPKKQIRPIVREIRRFTEDLRELWGEDSG
jgi:membrane protein implicated in regulation of membrane protease activity